MRRSKKTSKIVGWREWVALPDLGVDRIKAKIDTGARTSALHAFRIKRFKKDGQKYVSFYVHPIQRRRRPEVYCEAPLVDERVVTSSNGARQKRCVIETRMKLGSRTWPVEITLSDRDEMTFRMLIGRQALRRRLTVDPGSSYLISAPRPQQTRDTRTRK